ncbi:hypothetical protein GIB67_003740 [Kingdonia uniflora]|uniref:ERCC4 domain-containing protein n=1 Tax=Kingdonia uniflora TaxID=39325 RepID=A0A7J7MSU6_9MAGN|nr:hypothetical protein GIB67_003740 [Kingdonia uniflora]
MSQPVTLEILSDDEDDEQQSKPSNFKKRNPNPNQQQLGPHNIVILDDDPTPKKPNPSLTSTPSFVPETPMSSSLFKSDASFVKCSTRVSEDKFSGIRGFICLESDNEFEGSCEKENSEVSDCMAADYGLVMNKSFASSSNADPHWTGSLAQVVHDIPMHHEHSSGDPVPQACNDHEKNFTMEQLGNSLKQKDTILNGNLGKMNRNDEVKTRKRKTNEDKIRLAEEKKLKKEEEKLQKQASKAEALKMKNLQKKQQKWEKGKSAETSIVAHIDAKVAELGMIGGTVLSRLAEKGVKIHVTSNPIEKSILWKMEVPEEIFKLSSKGPEVPYVLLVCDAEEFCNSIISGCLLDHVCSIRSRHPSYTICYLVNRLMAYINKKEQAQFKNSSSSWRRPPVEEVGYLKKMFKKKLTRLSVNANGSFVPKEFVDKSLIKKSVWLKALVAIPKVQPRFAVAIWKNYPTMRSLLKIYMDPSKTLYEKESLLKDLRTEGLLGEENRRVGEVCSKRVYRILMAQNGNIKTDEVEDGADFFR